MLKQQSGFQKKRIIAIISSLSLEQYFSWPPFHSPDMLLTACWPELLPQASDFIRSYIPNISWKATSDEIGASASQKAKVTGNSDAQSSSSSGSQIRAQHVLPAQHAPPAQQTRQLGCTELSCTPLPLAAIVLDLGLRQPGQQTRRLYIVKVRQDLPQGAAGLACVLLNAGTHLSTSRINTGGWSQPDLNSTMTVMKRKYCYKMSLLCCDYPPVSACQLIRIEM